ncbi:hypothetical protein MA16_Dca015209 [Dendrobium catenatum]|uniref:Uncharacterized protein n=1 Tax=Dendrobium catenatum TaxID=906689 RepID=A0A2I0XAQ1_9ASPA|nr:hypothetical protein MA16_Dca015209 [Dendrobium catenatum]
MFKILPISEEEKRDTEIRGSSNNVSPNLADSPTMLSSETKEARRRRVKGLIFGTVGNMGEFDRTADKI